MHRFEYNHVLPLTGNDVILFSSLGVLQVVYRDGFWKGDPYFKLVINSNHTNIMHCFRYNQVLPLAENDIIVISPLGGAEGNSLGWILEGRPRLDLSF